MSNSPPESGSKGQGRLIVISGPSGTGKTSVCNALLQRLPNAAWSVSATTRPRRPGDVAGESYEFVTPEEFEKRKADGAFLEYAQYVGHQYGTPRRPVEKAVAEGRFVVLEIDVQGGMQVAKTMPDSLLIFILPPSPESLRARLEGRKTEAAEQLAKRLGEADGEIAVARDSGCYHHFVVNDVLDDTIDEVKNIILEEQVRA